jgi:hypothetical protein
LSNKEKNDVDDARQIIFGIIIPKEKKRVSKTNTATNSFSFRLKKKERNLANINEGDENNLLAFLSLFPSGTLRFQSSFLLLLRRFPFFFLLAEERCILDNDDAASDEIAT